jgi:hypothetical protein
MYNMRDQDQQCMVSKGCSEVVRLNGGRLDGCIIHRHESLDLPISGGGTGYNNTNTTIFSSGRFVSYLPALSFTWL